MTQRFVRDLRAGARLQTFLVSATAAVLTLRLFLEITGYPQLGPGGLHIAHMLWGGLLMLAAIVILFSFIGKEIERFAVVIAGIGFGTFIDEVGKFLTQDNDYFYRPAVAIIYVTFVLLYFATRAIHTLRAHTQTEYLVNALVEMEDVVLHDLDEEESKRLETYLGRSDPGHPMTRVLRRALKSVQLVPGPAPSMLTRAGKWLGRQYRRVATRPTFSNLIVGIFLAELMVKLSYIVLVAFAARPELPPPDPAIFELPATRAKTISFSQWAEIGSWALSALFVARGMFVIRRSRISAFRSFEGSVLVAIFITHVFSFYRNQFLGLLGLSFSVFMLISVRYAIRQERVRATPRSPGRAA
ncbi:MAG TPA: hypothetical protein VFP58_13135 [Candidatus Eisenbacteria bacterium]|nr:hypothetical protein [Candidatus Eisenbacteria bacterium]